MRNVHSINQYYPTRIQGAKTVSAHPLKSILMTQPWKRSEDTTKTLVIHQKTNSSQLQKPLGLSAQHVSWLWMELTKIYGQLFLTKFGTHDNGTWFEALKGLTPKALESGMDRLRNLSGNGKFVEYPPNCLQFKALCLDFYDELNLPKASIAYREIKNSVYRNVVCWSHKLTAFIAQRLPDDFFLIEQENVAYTVFKEIYEQVCHLVKQGHEIPTIDATPYRTKRTRSAEVAKAHLNEIKRHIGV